MSLDLKKIYELLPAVYRTRDARLALQLGMLDSAEQAELTNLQSIKGPLSEKQGQRLTQLQEKAQRGPLKALIAVITGQLQVLEESLEQAYDDQFIETCQEWVVPYIGDLVGARGLHVFRQADFSLRAQVANTLANRRRKGTVSMLEGLAHDVTGWDANVVEFFQVIATTQYMKHIRPRNLSMVEVRGAEARLLNTPFDPDAHTADVHNIDTLRGKYNIPNIGIFLWRIASNAMENSPAYQLDARRFQFDAIGRDIVLYTDPATVSESTQRVTPLNVPIPISRRMLHADLKQYKVDQGLSDTSSYFGPDASISIDYVLPVSPPVAIPKIACDLSDLKDSGGNVTGWAHQPLESIAIDPALGRIAFPSNQPAPTNVHVSYHYGFSAEIGGGQYERDLDPEADVLIKVPDDMATIQAALNQVVTQLVGDKTYGVVEIQDNKYYFETPVIAIPSGKTIELRAKDEQRPILVLSGDFNVSGGSGSAFQLDGLMISGGSISVPGLDGAGNPNQLDQLNLAQCTLFPGPSPQIGAVPAQLAAPRLLIGSTDVSLLLNQCISGSIRAVEGCDVTIKNSIVDALGPTEIAYAAFDSMSAGGTLTVQNSTIIGKVHARLMGLASNTIFFAQLMPMDLWRGPVIAEQLQQGCVRFSYVPRGSHVPRRYRCQPVGDGLEVVHPAFTSLRCGDAGYCQLGLQSGAEILQGADDQSEMGVFHDLFQPQRESNLRSSLQEYLRFGLEAGIFHAS